MDTLLLKVVFTVFWLGAFLIRYPFAQKQKKNLIKSDRKTGEEKILLACATLGMVLLPMLYVFTPLFSFANYQLPVFLNLIGIALTVPTLWLFYRSHKDLGRNWSPTLEIREEHQIVDWGVYKHIRHPMYTAIWLRVILQALLLPNYISGLSGLVGFGLLYALRVNKEEAMMLEQFGKPYAAYRTKTTRLIPFIF